MTAPHKFKFTAPWESTVPITASIPCQLWLSKLTHQRTEQPWCGSRLSGICAIIPISIRTFASALGGLGKPKKSLNILFRHNPEHPALRNMPDGIVDGIGDEGRNRIPSNAIDRIGREKRQTAGQALQAVG